MNLKDFSLLKEDNDSYHVRHPQGKTLVVSKQGMASKAHDIIKSLKKPHMADGGEMSVDVSPKEVVDASKDVDKSTAKEDQDLANAKQSAAALDNGYHPQGYDAIVNPPSATPVAQAQQSMQPATNLMAMSPALMGQVQQAGQMGAQGAQELGQAGEAIENTAKQNEPVLAQQQQNAQNIAQQLDSDFVQHYQQQQQKTTDLQNAFASGKIDPNHLINNMSTGSKITAGLGVILGGLGASVYGGKNPAMDVINSAIDRDIDAQKNNRSGIATLYEMNRQTMGDEMSAHLQTQNQVLGAVRAKLENELSRAGGAQNKVAAANALNDITIKQDAIMKQQAAFKALQGSQMAPEDKIRMMGQVGLMNPDQQKTAFSELDRNKNLATQGNAIMDLFDKGAKDTTLVKTLGGIRTPAAILGFRQAIMPYLKDAEGRINEQEIKIVQDNEPKPGDTDTKVQQKRRNMQAFLKEKASGSMLKAYGIVK